MSSSLKKTMTGSEDKSNMVLLRTAFCEPFNVGNQKLYNDPSGLAN